MEFSIKSGKPEKQRNDCVIVAVYESKKLSAAANVLDQVSGGQITAVLKHGDIDGKAGSTLLLHSLTGVTSPRTLLVGLGKESDVKESDFRKAVAASIKALAKTGAKNAASFLAEVKIKRQSLAWKVAQLAEVASDATYQFEQVKGKARKEDKAERREIEKLEVHVAQASEIKTVELALKQGLALAAGVRFAKDLGNLPPNVCTPT